MAGPSSPIPPGVDIQVQAQSMAATKQVAVATLTAAIVTNMNRPVSIAEVLDIQHDVYFAMFPEHNLASYQAWAKTRDETLAKVHK